MREVMDAEAERLVEEALRSVLRELDPVSTGAQRVQKRLDELARLRECRSAGGIAH